MRYSVNYTINFGIDVSQKEIDGKRKWLQAMFDNPKCSNSDYIWDLEITKDSTDEQIAQFIGVENWRSAEGIELELDDIGTYDEKRENELEEEDEERKKAFREMNPQLFNNLSKKEAEMIVSLIRFNATTDKNLNKEYYEQIADKLEKRYSLKEKKL